MIASRHLETDQTKMELTTNDEQYEKLSLARTVLETYRRVSADTLADYTQRLEHMEDSFARNLAMARLNNLTQGYELILDRIEKEVEILETIEDQISRHKEYVTKLIENSKNNIP